MDLLLIVRDALAPSLAGTLLTALRTTESGRQVGVLFTQEALAALAGGSFGWPRELSGQATRLRIADRAAAADLPVHGRGEGRRFAVEKLLARARGAGVVLYACPVWSSLLDLEGALPEGVEKLEENDLPRLLADAKRVVGSL